MNTLIHHAPLDDIFRGFFVRPVELGNTGDEAPQVRVDVKENADCYEVHAELPGIKKEDIHVHIDGPVVSISAERKLETELKDGERVLRTERYYGKVSRSFQLGQDIDEARAGAKFVDGVLKLSLPKKVESQATRLVIQ
ncbi:hypothetical protein AGMMS50225_11310 [Betaproteobacteria bacterium]|nr:hypothetical protein AGMMS50225_11310 [Betaproteobacteria bacterium]